MYGLRVVREEILAHLRQRRDLAVRVGELLHHVLAVDVRDELERLALVPGAARDHQHVAVAVGDVLQARIADGNGAAAHLPCHRRLLLAG